MENFRREGGISLAYRGALFGRTDADRLIQIAVAVGLDVGVMEYRGLV